MVYSKFKGLSFESDITLQKLVNRAVDKYIEDSEFRSEINEYTLVRSEWFTILKSQKVNGRKEKDSFIIR